MSTSKLYGHIFNGQVIHLTKRAWKVLRRKEISTLPQLAKLSAIELWGETVGCGKTTADELRKLLKENNLTFADEANFPVPNYLKGKETMKNCIVVIIKNGVVDESCLFVGQERRPVVAAAEAHFRLQVQKLANKPVNIEDLKAMTEDGYVEFQDGEVLPVGDSGNASVCITWPDITEVRE